MHSNHGFILRALLAASIVIATGCASVQRGTVPAYVPSRDVVQVSGGSLSAAADSPAALRAFTGIPFAAPPLGDLRWKAPQPVIPWRGVRRSDSFASACMMEVRAGSGPHSILNQAEVPQSEDCLYLNVWTGAAAPSEKRPVMMFLYGGGYRSGAGSLPNYDGTGLASKGAVVVTMNYRVGALGFLGHPALSAESPQKVSGNYALLDAIAALQWIQQNIAQFGGDANNVTLYSQSAGAGLASVLLASPLAKGIFHRMMLSSFGSWPDDADTPSLAQAEAAGAAYADKLGAPSLAALRAKLPQAIMAGDGLIRGPIVDGYVMLDQLDRLFARGLVNDVPLLAGWNADEGTSYPPFATDLAGYEATANKRFGAYAAQFKQVYPATSDAEVQTMAYGPFRDGTFAWQAWTIARAHAALKKSKTYLYFFNRRPPYFSDQKFDGQDPPNKFGAFHTLEQPYFYNNLDWSAPPRPYTAIDRHVADVASNYLINFARSGNPNGDSLTGWPVFMSAGSQVMVIGDTIAPGAAPFQPALSFFDSFNGAKLGRPLPFQ